MGPRPTVRAAVVAAVALALSLAHTAAADPRPFTFVYDTYPEGKGNFEYEQYVTWSGHTSEDSDFNHVEFRHEFEMGVTDNFDLSFYVPTWFYEHDGSGGRTRFDTVGVEGIVYLSNPVTDAVGLGLYQEIDVGEHELEFETKLLVHKDVGNWTFAYNLILETELEGVFRSSSSSDGGAGGGGADGAEPKGGSETEGVLGHSFGASYNVGAGGWRVGAEAQIESVYANWSRYEDTTVYAGPVISWSNGKNFYVTVTPAFQLTDVADEGDFKLRMIAGFEF